MNLGVMVFVVLFNYLLTAAFFSDINAFKITSGDFTNVIYVLEKTYRQWTKKWLKKFQDLKLK